MYKSQIYCINIKDNQRKNINNNLTKIRNKYKLKLIKNKKIIKII